MVRIQTKRIKLIQMAQIQIKRIKITQKVPIQINPLILLDQVIIARIMVNCQIIQKTIMIQQILVINQEKLLTALRKKTLT